MKYVLDMLLLLLVLTNSAFIFKERETYYSLSSFLKLWAVDNEEICLLGLSL